MNKSQRIYFDTNNIGVDKYVKIKLEQDVKTLEFLTLNLNTEDVYQNYNSDYGVLVGRVLANGGIGVPNARISIFIPLTDIDAEDGVIYSIYPYKSPNDKNNDGKRYNLLPRVGKINSITGEITPKQPFGSFPIKEEIVTNEPYLNVYKKYYKYTALTNENGDYMIFGVPIGTQTVHLSVDITDIGEYSMTPAAMVKNLGYSENLFTNDNSRIKPSNDLTDLPHIETQEITVNIIPFWGDTENFDIGITRQDFRIRSILQNTFIIFGSVFTDGDGAMWGDEDQGGTRRIEELYNATDDANVTVGMASKRIGKITEKIFYYPADITDEDINNGNTEDDCSDMRVLDQSEYSFYKRDGDFVFIISCNRNKITKDEFGNKIQVSPDSIDGIFTEFRGFITLEITDETIPMQFSSEIGVNTKVTPFRYKLKFPQSAQRNQSFSVPDSSQAGTNNAYNIAWRKQHYTFSGGSFYSLAKFHGLTLNKGREDPDQFPLNVGFFKGEDINYVNTDNAFHNVGIIVNGEYGYDSESGEYTYDNNSFEFPSNATTLIGTETVPCFGANWMNLAIHLPQLGYLTQGSNHVRRVRSADHFTQQIDNVSTFNSHFYLANNDPIAADVTNTQFMARSDLNWTDFIYVPKEDIYAFKKTPLKGDKTDTDGKTIRISGGTYTLKGNYRNGSTPCPIDGGKLDGIPTNSTDTKTYFYKGFNNADCVEYLSILGII